MKTFILFVLVWVFARITLHTLPLPWAVVMLIGIMAAMSIQAFVALVGFLIPGEWWKSMLRVIAIVAILRVSVFHLPW